MRKGRGDVNIKKNNDASSKLKRCVLLVMELVVTGALKKRERKGRGGDGRKARRGEET